MLYIAIVAVLMINVFYSYALCVCKKKTKKKKILNSELIIYICAIWFFRGVFADKV